MMCVLCHKELKDHKVAHAKRHHGSCGEKKLVPLRKERKAFYEARVLMVKQKMEKQDKDAITIHIDKLVKYASTVGLSEMQEETTAKLCLLQQELRVLLSGHDELKQTVQLQPQQRQTLYEWNYEQKFRKETKLKEALERLTLEQTEIMLNIQKIRKKDRKSGVRELCAELNELNKVKNDLETLQGHMLDNEFQIGQLETDTEYNTEIARLGVVYGLLKTGKGFVDIP